MFLVVLGNPVIHSLVSLPYRKDSYVFTVFRKVIYLMDKIQICVLEMASTSAASFKYLPDTLSIPAALLIAYVFKRFEIQFA